MYRDPTQIRDHVVKVRLNDRENELLEAWANYTGEQKAVLVRKLVLEQACIEFTAIAETSEVPQLALFRS